MSKSDVFSDICRDRVVAIARGIPAELLLPAAEALAEGGVKLLEITFPAGSFRTEQDGKLPNADEAARAEDETAQCISQLARRMRGTMRIGAGTVMTVHQAVLAAQAGAEFMLAPDVSEAVIRRGGAEGLVTVPGALTPTEIANAFRWGADMVKVFPAGLLGPAYLRAVCAPLGHVPLMAVGGITADNTADYLEAGACSVGVGSALLSRSRAEPSRRADLVAAARRFCTAASQPQVRKEEEQR